MRATNGQIVIVGGGLAGLTCAWRLRQAGLRAHVFEANDRLGGRCWTDRDSFADGQHAERGGEFIDSNQRAILGLARELGLELDDVHAASPEPAAPQCHFDGVVHAWSQLADDFAHLYPILREDYESVRYNHTWRTFGAAAEELDAMSVAGWIEAKVAGGLRSRLGALLAQAYAAENGADAAAQSALNLVLSLGESGRRPFSLYGESDERFKIRGGNDALIHQLAARLMGRITPGARLLALTHEADGSYSLKFAHAGRTRVVDAAHVVLALPFAALRKVDITRAGFRSLKRVAIAEQVVGAHVKRHYQFTRRVWHDHEGTGETYSNSLSQTTWEASRAQPGGHGLLVNLTTDTSDAPHHARVAALDAFWPDASAVWNGRATSEDWRANPLSGGSYSYYGVGQYTRFAGIEAEREGNCHFCGEHVSLEHKGFLNGAVETAEHVARALSDKP